MSATEFHHSDRTKILSIKLGMGNFRFLDSVNGAMAIPLEVNARSLNQSFTRNKRKMDAVVPKSEKQTRKAEKLTREKVGNKLKQLYADVVAEPVPDRFMDLIEQLDSGPEKKKISDSADNQKDSY